MRRLVLAEKYSAALRFVRILSEGMAENVWADGVRYFRFSSAGIDWTVFPLRSHIVEIDYPDAKRDWSEADLEALIDAEPIREESPSELHDALRNLAEEVDEVVLATDYDREGELIGVEALETLRARRPDLPARRARFSSMSALEIRRAFNELGEPDWNLAAAAAARQKIDLAWGAVLTRFLTLRCGSGPGVLSAGRVQTPTLALVAAREREREEFASRPFWSVRLVVGDPPFEATAPGEPFWDEGGASSTAALARLSDVALVESVERTEESEPPPAPFNTTSFLAEASRRGLGASRAMMAAQSLYVRGDISYPRTDNTVYPASLPVRDLLERLRQSSYRVHVEGILASPVLEPTRGGIRTTDHPPIHPTGVPRIVGRGPRAIAYDVIVRRFLATFSPPCRWEVTTVRLRTGGIEFRAVGRRILEPGWRGILPDDPPPAILPSLRAGDVVPIRDLRIVRSQTWPPPLYTQGSLLLAMERLGLGTKSTRHEIVDLLFRRGYVSGRRLRTTAAGRALVEALALHGPMLTSPEMTRRLEEQMTWIAEGTTTLSAVVDESRQALRSVLAELRAHEASLGRWLQDAMFLERDFGPCDACHRGRLVRRRARNGWSFLGCSEYPTCGHRMRMGRLGTRLPWAPERAAAEA